MSVCVCVYTVRLCAGVFRLGYVSGLGSVLHHRQFVQEVLTQVEIFEYAYC